MRRVTFTVARDASRRRAGRRRPQGDRLAGGARGALPRPALAHLASVLAIAAGGADALDLAHRLSRRAGDRRGRRTLAPR